MRSGRVAPLVPGTAGRTLTSALLILGAVLTGLALAVPWASTPGYLSPGTTTLVNQYNPVTGGLDLNSQYVPGFYSPGAVTLGRQSPVRVVLVPAIAVLVLACVRRSARTRRLSRGAAWALAGCAVYAVGQRQTVPVVVTALAAVAVASAVRSPLVPPATTSAAGAPAG